MTMISTHYQKQLEYKTKGRGLYDLTQQTQGCISGQCDGLCHVFVHHTSASLLITENADAEVHRDLERFFSRLVPDGDRLFRHTAEGIDDMPGHIRSALTQTHLSIPIAKGCLALGVWQGIYLWEHRLAAHTRKVTVSVQSFLA